MQSFFLVYEVTFFKFLNQIFSYFLSKSRKVEYLCYLQSNHRNIFIESYYGIYLPQIQIQPPREPRKTSSS